MKLKHLSILLTSFVFINYQNFNGMNFSNFDFGLSKQDLEREQKKAQRKSLENEIINAIKNQFPNYTNNNPTPDQEQFLINQIKQKIRDLKLTSTDEPLSNKTPMSNLSILNAALQSGSLELVKFLDQCGANFETENLDVFYAAIKYPRIIKWILEEKKPKLNIDECTHLGTPLMYAVKKQETATVKLLLKHGANPWKFCKFMQPESNPFIEAFIYESTLPTFLQHIETLNKDQEDLVIGNYPSLVENIFITLSLILAFPNAKKLIPAIQNRLNKKEELQPFIKDAEKIHQWGLWFQENNINPFKIFKPDIELIIQTLLDINQLAPLRQESCKFIFQNLHQLTSTEITALSKTNTYKTVLDALNLDNIE